MKSRVSILGVAVVAASCGGQATPPPATRPAASTPPAATQAAPPATGDAAFGVQECDDYINAFLACVDAKVPEASRAMMRQQLEQTREQWKMAASTSEGRASLAVGCRASRDAAKTSMAAYGCSF
jgi:hypothetical protein